MNLAKSLSPHCSRLRPLFEALGRSAMEAILMRIPVVANNVWGVSEYIKDQETGLLVELDNTVPNGRCFEMTTN